MQLFPITITSIRPASGGKDVRLFGIGEDSFDYAIKTATENARLPATEMFCYRLAAACRLPVPNYAILKLPGSEDLAFGSRFEGGLTTPGHATHEDLMRRIRDCAKTMSAAFAMDMFVGNEDRHMDNFLYRSNSANTLACLPIDYSRAWMAGGWPPRNIAQSACTTMNSVNLLRSFDCWDRERALLALSQINSIQPMRVEQWMDEMPPGWVTAGDKKSVVGWWGGREFQSRIQECMKHCQ